MSQKASNATLLKALKMYRDDLYKLHAKIVIKRDKEVEKIKKMAAEYKSEDEIMDAYGYNAITERQKDKLLLALEDRQKALDEPTVFKEYLRMLRHDLKNIEIEVQELSEGGR